jgi:hypothetical protein
LVPGETYSVPGCAQTLGTITSEVKDTSGATIPGAMVSDVPRQPHSEQSEESDLAEASRVLSGAERGGHGEQLCFAAESRDRPEAVHAADGFRAELEVELDGSLQLQHDDEVTPALKLNGSKLLNTVDQVMIANTHTLSPTLLNEARFGFNSFFNTLGRELALVSDVVDEFGIPGVAAGTPESWGIPPVGISASVTNTCRRGSTRQAR